MFNTGHLFVFEGADGSGKSAICSAFDRFLRKQRVDAQLVSFPGKTPGTIGELVYRIHHEPKACGVERLTAASLQALHIAAHLDAIETTIVPALNRGKWIVLDRYWWSTWAYGCAELVPPDVLEALVKAERCAWGQWEPNVVFYVTRVDPLRPEPMEKWRRVKASYEGLLVSERGKHPIQVLNNDGTLEDTLDQAASRIAAFQP